MDHRHAELVDEGAQVGGEVAAEIAVHGREGLVEEDDARVHGEGPRQRDALRFAAGERRRAARGEVGDAEARQQLRARALRGGVAERSMP